MKCRNTTGWGYLPAKQPHKLSHALIGVIYTVHHLSRAVKGKYTAVNPVKFFEHIADHTESVMDFTIYQWCQPWRIKPVPGLQNVKPLGGMFNGQASFGIGLVQPIGQKYQT